jgi:hypothetical protein
MLLKNCYSLRGKYAQGQNVEKSYNGDRAPDRWIDSRSVQKKST